MSAPAQNIASTEVAGTWVTSGVEYLRLVTRSRETRSQEAECDSAAAAGGWSDPLDLSVSLSTDSLREFLKSRLKSIPEVSRVKIAQRTTRNGEPSLHIWSSLTRDDRATRFKVYDVEQELVDRFPELIFEFHSHLDREDAPDGDTVVYKSRLT